MKSDRLAVRYDPGLVRSAQLPEDVETYLLREGLPWIESGEAILGVRFQADVSKGLIQAGERRLLPVGYMWEPNRVVVGLAEKSGHVYIYDCDSGQSGFVNSNIQLLLLFLSYIRSFQDRHSTGEQVMVMTLAEAQDRLAALRRGEIVPKKQPYPKHDRKADLAKIRELFMQKDPVSMAGDDSWWSVILEQLEDGLL